MLLYKPFMVNPLGVNCFVAYDDETLDAAIIDPGMFYAQECEEVAAFIADNDLHVSHILLTHGHFDHVMGVRWCAAEYGVTPLLHSADHRLAYDLERQALLFMRRTLGATATESLAAIADGDILRIGNVEMQVIHTPGHTPGGVCYYVPSAQLVFTGDTLFNNGVGRTDFEGGSAQTLFTSIRERLFTLPSETKVLPGHGPSTTIGDEM